MSERLYNGHDDDRGVGEKLIIRLGPSGPGRAGWTGRLRMVKDGVRMRDDCHASEDSAGAALVALLQDRDDEDHDLFMGRRVSEDGARRLARLVHHCDDVVSGRHAPTEMVLDLEGGGE